MKRFIHAYLVLLVFVYISGAFIMFDFLWFADIASWTPQQRVGVWYLLFFMPGMGGLVWKIIE